MAEIALIYAQTDGAEAAARLRTLLATLGHAVAAESSTALLLLTPAALTDAEVVGRLHQQPPPISLPVPNPTTFPSAADLATILAQLAASTGGGSKYVVVHNQGAVGDYATVVNAYGHLSPHQYTALLDALRRHGEDEILSSQELRATLSRIEKGIDRLDQEMRQRFTFLEEGQWRTVRILLNRLDAQEASTLDAILEAIETNAVAADELDRQLVTLQSLLLSVQEAQIADPVLFAATAQINEMVSAPGLDFKHKLKVGIPLIPLLLHYEGEMELSGGFNLEEIWRSLQRWAAAPR
ncbi:MAG: hypothetical protein KF893_22170 [Caldilineaceae bacterium]|nr:hypothetical protein [Caldilineaceae bacterium]